MNAQQLKNAILQEAIEGRLVPQDPNDEPASALLARIRKEKERLVREGKLKKKDLEVKPISEDEIPFEIPYSWEWVRLCQLSVSFSTGPFGTMVHKEDYVDTVGHPLVNPTNIKNGHICSDGIKMVSNSKYEELSSYVLQSDDLVLARRGDLSKIAIVTKLEEGWLAGTGAFFMHFIGGLFLPYFVKLYSTSYCQNYLLDQSVGGTMNNLNQKLLADFVIPLPPLAEQRRIVMKIEELLPKVEECGKAQDALNKLNEELPERLKKSILQEAIEGRLVPQDPNDEPVSVLLAQIRKEKEQLVKAGKLKKKDLVETPISEDELPFEIPENWEWVRLGEISTYANTKKKINAATAAPDLWGLDLEDIEKGGRLLSFKTVGERKAIGDKTCFSEGDILYSKLRPYLLKILIAPKDGICTPEIIPFTCYGDICKEYIVNLLKSSYVDEYINSVTFGVKMPRVSTETMTSLVLPLPPLAEQYRIVEKLEQLLGEIDKLKK